MAAGRRAERVGRQVVQALASILESEAHDPRLAGVTITAARMTDDLRNVRVFFAVFGDAKAATDAAAGLEKASGYLRRELAHRLELRYAPALAFEHDDAMFTADRIENLLKGARDGSPE
jgi:ribosome-binding factor A